MAYEKQTWTTGEVITQEKLNHMEDGIAEGGGVVVVNVTTTASEGGTVTTLDKTWQEIYDAVMSTGAVFMGNNGGVTSIAPVLDVAFNPAINKYSVGAFDASSPSDYPKAQGEIIN